MPFEKGRAKTGGRVKGVLNKDTTNYLDLQLWFKRTLADIELLESAQQRLPFEIQMIDKLLMKIPVLPSTPGDSLSNAIQTQQALKELETKEQNEINAQST